MKFSFKINDLAGIALLLLAGLLVYVACAHAQRAQRKPSSAHILELPMVTPRKAFVPKVNGKGAAKPQASQVFKIGIIDTGYDKSLDDQKLKICDEGSYDFGMDRPGVGHTHFHGTAVAQTIASQLEDVEYCFVIYQVAGPLGITSYNLAAALKKAATAGLVAVNISLEGSEYSFQERADMWKLASRGTAIFVAAGNRHMNLDTACMSYPGCYGLPNVYVVGATQDQGQFQASYSNYGTKVHVWKDGQIEFGGQTMQGTSFASPRALGDYVRSLSSVAQ